MTTSWEEATRRQYDTDANLAARQALFAFLVEATPLAPPLDDLSALTGQRVLDVGCGNGVFLANAVKGGANAVGCDLSMGMARAATEAAGAPVMQADAHALPLATDSVDTALALWMLYHVTDRQLALREIARVLRPGGVLVATTNIGAIGQIGELVTGCLADLLERPVDRWIPELSFTAENGAEVLADVFGGDAVEVHPFTTAFEVDDPAVLVGYAGSMLEPMHEQVGAFDDQALLHRVGERCEEQLAGGGPIRIERAGAAFICRP